MSELKPCPFCGAKPTIVKLNGGYDAGRKDNYGHFAITCERCGIRFQTFVVSSIIEDDGELFITNTKSEAIEAWNEQEGRNMSKQDILDFFSDINHAYNDSTRLNTLSRMLDGLVEQVASPWRRVEDGLPESNDAVNVVWVNRNPESYYAGIKDKPFVATAHYHKGKWYWFSATCKDFLDEYGRCEVDEVDKDIDILYWMPLPSAPVNKMFTK